MAKDINKVLQAFHGVKRISGFKWKAVCPCHDDKNASLMITNTPDKVLMCCMAGCNTLDVLNASGLTWSDLGSGTDKQGFACLERILYGKRKEYGESTIIRAKYDYTDAKGGYLYTKIRFEGGSFEDGAKKLIRYFRIDYANDTYEPGRGDIPKALYRLPELIGAIREGFPVCITEGEKDAETLRSLGWTATTAGGVNDWKPEFAPVFKGAAVLIFPDNDKAGTELANKIRFALADYAYKVKLIKTSEAEKGDVTDYLEEDGHDKNTLLNLIQSAETIPASWLNYKENRHGEANVSTNSDLLARVFSKNEHYLICRTAEDETDRLYIYSDGVYRRSNRNDLKTMIRQYHYKGTATANGIDNVLKMLLYDGSHLCDPDAFDTDEYTINVKNGLLDIRTWRLKPHTPDYISKWQFDVNFHPEDTICPTFTKYINDLCTDEYGRTDEQKKLQLQEIAGLIVSNVKGYRTKKAAFLYSAMGDSGKSQFINLIQRIIGEDKTANIPLASMKPDNRFALDRLPRCRLVSVGDQTDATVTDSTTFKQLTGSDLVRVEEKGKASYSVRFTGFMLYGCNALPEFRDDKGNHLFNRLLIIPCVHAVPEAERDPEITDKMYMERDAIFNWMLEGLRRLISNNFRFTKSEASEAILESYRSKVDSVFRFMGEAGYIITDNMRDAVSKTDFYNEYTAWCADNGIENMLQLKNLTDRMEKYGCVFNPKANLSDGRRGYAGYQKLRKAAPDRASGDDPDNEGFSLCELEEIPFD